MQFWFCFCRNMRQIPFLAIPELVENHIGLSYRLGYRPFLVTFRSFSVMFRPPWEIPPHCVVELRSFISHFCCRMHVDTNPMFWETYCLKTRQYVWWGLPCFIDNKGTKCSSGNNNNNDGDEVQQRRGRSRLGSRLGRGDITPSQVGKW